MAGTIRRAVLAVGLAFASPAALAPAALAPAALAEEVTIAVGGAFTSLDPHFHNLTPNSALTQHLFDRLLDPDENLRPTAGLAESWRAVDDTTWEFRLRENARFHDGTPFTADDVAFTLARVPNVPNSPSSYAIYTRPVREVVVVDARTVQLRTAAPAPLIPAFMQALPMIGRKHGEGAATADYNSGRAAIGTGPYRLVSFTPGDRAVFERNDSWWGPRQPWTTLTVRLIANDAARVAALQAGDVQLIDQVPTRDVATVLRDQRLAVFSVPGVRNIYLALDHARDDTPFVTALDGSRLPVSPLKDVRVRRALSLAINRTGIVGQMMDGQAAASGQFLPAGAVGHDPALKPDAHDVAQARLLLAEAGYAEGFAVTLHGPNDRYVNDAQIIQAIAQMWARIGVRTRVEAMPSAVFFGRSAREEFSLQLLGWGTGTGEPDSPMSALVATPDRSRGRGGTNRSLYGNPAFDAVLDRALATLDPVAREALYREGTRIAMADLAIIPLHHQVNVWAARRGYIYTPRSDERTLATGFRRAP